MMSARLSSILVAGGVVLVGIQPGFMSAATPVSVSTTVKPSVLQGATLSQGNGSEVILNLDIPAFAGIPKLQILPHPNRVVIDLPGVTRGIVPTKKDLATWSSPLIQKARLAQFVMAPEPVTRLVLEVSDGTQVLVSKSENGLQLAVQPGVGTIQARLLPPAEFIPAAPANALLNTIDHGSNNPAPVIESGTNAVNADSGSLLQVVEAQTAPVAASSVPTASTISTVGAKQALPISNIPSIKYPEQATSNLVISTLLPATVSTIQEKPSVVPPSMRKDEARGRTLGDSQGRYTGSRITIDVKGAELSTFLRIIADHAKLNLVADQDVQGIYDFKFTDTPWDQVLDIIVKHAGLGMEINNGVIRVAKIEKLQKEEDDRKKLDEAKALAGELTTITRPLSFAKASEAKGIIEKILTKRGSIIVDDRTNVLIISELPKNVPLIDDLIQQLDIQIQQVQIEARVVEANGSFDKAFGVIWPSSKNGAAQLSVGGKDAVWSAYGASPSWNSWGGSIGHPANSNKAGSISYDANNGITGTPAGDLWVSFLSNKFSVNVILQALEKNGKVRIVSNPKIVTQNNKKAIILAGAKIPYQSIQSAGGAGGATSITTSFIDANLELDVTPQITNDGTIIMDLKIDKSEADFSNEVNGTPTITQKKIETQVLVRDGGTAVLGGVYQTTTNHTTQGVPVLAHIPVIGWLFRNKQDHEENKELLVFITPRILKM
jgi:type IV pilus assembly protein PilQ